MTKVVRSLDIIETRESMESCAFDTLFSNNVPHLLEKVFFFLDYESYKTCLEVSDVWNNLLTSEPFRTKGKSVFYTELIKDGVKLYDTAREGDKDKVQQLLSTGMIDVNIKVNNASMTPLIIATHHGHRDIIQLLVDNGADLNKADRGGYTPLKRAAYYGQIITAKFLIDLGAEPGLTKAANKGQYAIIQVLLQAGADPNMTDLNGECPLLVAALNGYRDIVQLLIQQGANPNMGSKYGSTPLHWAASLGHKDVVKQLIDGGAEPNSTNVLGRTPLHCAVNDHKIEVVKLLMDMGADPNIADGEGKTPLTCAREIGYLDIVNILTEHQQHPPAPTPQRLNLCLVGCCVLACSFVAYRLWKVECSEL